MPFPFKFRRDKVVVESEGWRKSVSRSFVKVGGGGSGERSSAGGWRCWFAKKEKKRDGGGGGGGGGGLFGYLSNIANYPMALPYKTLLIIKLLNHN